MNATENAAPVTAINAAAQFGLKPRRTTDNEYGDGCWIAFEAERSAIVIYDDEPDAIVSTGNSPGRFAPIG